LPRIRPGFDSRSAYGKITIFNLGLVIK